MATRQYLIECFDYNRKTGILKWKCRPLSHFKNAAGMNIVNSNYAGEVAGVVDKGIYIRVRAKNKKFYAHRVIWMMEYGEWPTEIDHINGNGLDNRLENLRVVTRQQNCQNRRLRSDNMVGMAGVTWDIQRKKWKAYINIDKKFTVLGFWDNLFEACCRRKSAERIHDYHQNHGEVR